MYCHASEDLAGSGNGSSDALCGSLCAGRAGLDQDLNK